MITRPLCRHYCKVINLLLLLLNIFKLYNLIRGQRQVRQTGRPRIEINTDDILALRALNFKWTDIARILQISRSTLYNKLTELSISTYTQLTDVELDDIITNIRRDHPRDGEVLTNGHLVRIGVRVPRRRLRQSIHRVDHEATVARQGRTIRRRIYSVPYPNAVWHIDTHHKLIKWRFIIHAGIDGFSRTITYIRCFDNNQASTSLQIFRDGVAKFGLPDVVRTDHGGENIDIWQYMINARNGSSSCVITGSSTHNERIERLWRDVHRSVVHIFAETFRSIEAEEYLDPLNEVDMYCLHFIFLPRINKCLQEFQESWNNHSLSSEGNKTPYQLFVEGLLHHFGQNNTIPPTLSNMVNTNINQIDVPRNTFTPCSILATYLSTVDVQQECYDNGKLLYINTIQQIGHHLTGGCNNCTV